MNENLFRMNKQTCIKLYPHLQPGTPTNVEDKGVVAPDQLCIDDCEKASGLKFL